MADTPAQAFAPTSLQPSPPDAVRVSVLVRSMARPTLERALRSVLAQTHRPLDVVVVNASGQPHPLLPALPPGDVGTTMRLVNPGRALPRAAAANAALQAASGDWLLFLDDDDSLEPQHLARLLAARAADPQARALHAGVRMLDEQGVERMRFDSPVTRLDLWSSNRLPIHAVLFARSLLDDGVAFDERCSVYEDWDFWFQVSAHTPFVHVPGVSASYHLVGDSGASQVHSADESTRLRAPFYDKWSTVLRADELATLTAALEDARANLALLRASAGRSAHEADLLRVELSAAQRQLTDVTAQAAADRVAAAAAAAAAQAEARELAQRFAEADADRRALRQTWSWRLTAPLRRLRSRQS